MNDTAHEAGCLHSVEDLITEALQLLRLHGWYQGGAYGPGKSMCAEAAIIQAAEELRECQASVSKAYMKVRAAIIEQYPGCESAVYMFNDNPHVAWEDIERVMEKAALS